MIRKILSGLTALVLFAGAGMPAPAYTVQYHDELGILARRWLTNPIVVAFSTSLNSPPANIKSGSDLIGAAHRALQHWASAANIQFVETVSTVQTVSPPNAGDGVNLITVASDNAALFAGSDSPGRTRVFYDSGGAIVEADIALNPHQLFSSDGTFGTYDLEATLTHEVGHLLGLEHSAVIGATMQPRQAKNGLYGLPAFTQRTLSEDDCAGVRALYGSSGEIGSISGRLLINRVGLSGATSLSVTVFAEDLQTGKVVAGSIVSSAGDYKVGGLRPGAYRLIAQSVNNSLTASDTAATQESDNATSATGLLVRTFEISRAPLIVKSGADSNALAVFLFPNDPPPTIHPRLIGLNGELSTIALPIEAGKTFTIYVGGEGVDQIGATDISISSPFIKVLPDTLSLQEFGTPYPVISFEVAVAPSAPAGDYSIRLRASTGEIAFLPGVITIDLEGP